MGQLLELKCTHPSLNLRILSSTSVPCMLTTVQVPNLASAHKKRITVHINDLPSSVDRGLWSVRVPGEHDPRDVPLHLPDGGGALHGDCGRGGDLPGRGQHDEHHLPS
jgi:hypothetical protein